MHMYCSFLLRERDKVIKIMHLLSRQEYILIKVIFGSKQGQLCSTEAKLDVIK